MGFTASEIRKLTFKVQAANVIDADSGAFWYQSKLENSPAVKSERILTQYTVVKSNLPTGSTYLDQVASLETLVDTGNVLENIVGNAYSTGPSGTIISSRLSRVTAGLNNTWISYNTYNTPASGPKDLWINPASVPAANGDPTQGYTIQLYSGDPNAGGVKITTSVGQDANEVGWVWNYDMGVLFIANNLEGFLTGNPTYPAGLDFYVRGWRYVGTTGAGSGGAVAIEDGGVNVTTAVSKINFTGTGVTVTGSGTGNEDIEVAISGGLGSYSNATPTPQPFPGNSPFDNIPTGETFTNETFEVMMNKMLYPTLDPSLSPPSSGFTLTQQGLQETGATLGTLNFNATLNRGSINPQYTSASPFRSGLPNAYDYTGTTLPANVPSTSTSNAQTISNYLVLLGPQSWTNSVSFDAGVMPKDSVGGDFDPPGALSAGTTSTITRTITGVYRVFATTATAGTLSPQSLQSMTSTIQVSMVAEVSGGPKQAISIPAAWSTITGLKQFSPFTNQFEVVPNGLAAFTVTNENRNSPNGTSVAYKLYTHNGNTIGARQLQFTT